MRIMEMLRPHIDGDGLVQPHQPGHDGGRFSSEAIAGADFQGKLAQVKKHFLSALQNIERPEEPGVVRRTSDNRGGHQGLDSLIALNHAGQILQNGFPERFYEHGVNQDTRKADTTVEATTLKKFANWIGPLLARFIPYCRRWHFNNIQKNKWHWSPWMGKNPQVISHNFYCRYKKPNVIYRWFWRLSVKQSSLTDTDKGDPHRYWILGSHMVKAYRRNPINRDKRCDEVADLWSKRLRARYPLGGIGQCIDDENENKYHPNKKLLWGEFCEK